MKKLFQINSVINSGSTGRIAEEIGQTAIEAGWALEFTAGLGMARFEYDSYSLSGEGFQVGQGKKNYFGPTKGAVSIVYTIR